MRKRLALHTANTYPNRQTYAANAKFESRTSSNIRPRMGTPHVNLSETSAWHRITRIDANNFERSRQRTRTKTCTVFKPCRLQYIASNLDNSARAMARTRLRFQNDTYVNPHASRTASTDASGMLKLKQLLLSQIVFLQPLLHVIRNLNRPAFPGADGKPSPLASIHVARFAGDIKAWLPRIVIHALDVFAVG